MFGNRSGRVCRPGGLRKRRPGQGRAAGQQVGQGRQRPRPPPWLPGGSSLGRTERCPRSAPSRRGCEGDGSPLSPLAPPPCAAAQPRPASRPAAPAHARRRLTECAGRSSRAGSARCGASCPLLWATRTRRMRGSSPVPCTVFRPSCIPVFHIRVRCSRRRGSVAVLFFVRSPPVPGIAVRVGGLGGGVLHREVCRQSGSPSRIARSKFRCRGSSGCSRHECRSWRRVFFRATHQENRLVRTGEIGTCNPAEAGMVFWVADDYRECSDNLWA